MTSTAFRHRGLGVHRRQADRAARRRGDDGAGARPLGGLGEWGRWEDFERGNVEGTRNALAACAEAGVRRFVHCGTEAALMAGEPLVQVDETAPLRPDSRAPYPATKAKAERAVRDASREGSRRSSCGRASLGQGRHEAAEDGGHGRSQPVGLAGGGRNGDAELFTNPLRSS